MIMDWPRAPDLLRLLGRSGGDDDELLDCRETFFPPQTQSYYRRQEERLNLLQEVELH